LAQLKEDELQEVEEAIEGARILWKRFTLSGHLTPTVFNIFVYEYTHVKLTAAPKETWEDHQNAVQWRNFWNRSSDFTHNILCVGWMMGWEGIEKVRLPIVLAGCLPLHTLVVILKLVIKYQVELQRSPPASVEHTFQFVNYVYTIPTEGAELDVQGNEDRLMGTYSKVYLGNMKKVLQVLHSSFTNILFGGGNLMVAVARAMGHYKETFRHKAYVPFNVKDFSLPETYLKKERLDAKKHFNYKIRLQPSESGEFSHDQTDSDMAVDMQKDTQAGPSNPDPIPNLSPSRNPTPS